MTAKIKQGTVFVSHTGTDCTKVTFYKCLESTRETVLLQKVAGETVTYSAYYGCGRKIPTDTPQGEPFRRKLRQGTIDGAAETYIEIQPGELAYVWDGIAQLYSDKPQKL